VRPRERHFYFNGIRVGDVSNNGTSDIDYAASIAEHRAIPPAPPGYFRDGATVGAHSASADRDGARACMRRMPCIACQGCRCHRRSRGNAGRFVEGDQALSLMRELLWSSMLVAGPVLFVAMVTGVLVSVLQVATQLQEMTLSYVPKLFVSALVLMMFGSWMLHRITQFAIEMISIIPNLG
jgi:flagellar biosynthetic protein FliQ